MKPDVQRLARQHAKAAGSSTSAGAKGWASCVGSRTFVLLFRIASPWFFVGNGFGYLSLLQIRIPFGHIACSENFIAV